MKSEYLVAALLIGAAVLMQSCGRETNNTESPTVLAQASQGGCLCHPQRARDLGFLLLASNPINEVDPQRRQQFHQLIGENSEILSSDGATMICAARLGRALQQQGLASFNRGDYDRAYENVVANGGNVAMAQDVAGSMNQGAMDAWSTGRELTWLSQVLPAAAVGNWDPYWNTGTQTRNQVRQALAIIGSMPDMGSMMQQLQHLLGIFQPQIEEQMVMASCLFRQ